MEELQCGKYGVEVNVHNVLMYKILKNKNRDKKIFKERIQFNEIFQEMCKSGAHYNIAMLQLNVHNRKSV